MDISVVIPARNEELWLPLCLDSLTKQSTPLREIIVVDNGSTDDTAAVARSYGCTVLTEPIPGVGRARYTGCQKASSEIIATTDADSRVPADWAAGILDAFTRQPRCVAVTGPWRLFDGSMLARWSTALQAQGVLRLMSLLAPATVNMVGCNSAFRAEAYDRVGGFRPDLKWGEDLNLSLRLRSVGQVHYLSRLVVETSARRFKKSFLSGIGQYLPDASRQVGSYLFGKREALGAFYEPSCMKPKPAAMSGWTVNDENFFLEMGLALDTMTAGPGDGFGMVLAGGPIKKHDQGEEW